MSGPGVSGGGAGRVEDAAGAQNDRALQARVLAAVGDRYELEAEIGRGGMAVVYRARDIRLRRRVALKVLPPELAFRSEVRQRFLREAQTAAGLSHPNIVPIFSVDERDGIVYFAMGLVEGDSLAARLAREKRPPYAAVQRILRDVADALSYAHARGVVHRDVKPDNILLDRDSGRAMVTDFGIARAAEAGTRLTVTGIAVGTPTYMSPEQALGEREVDARSDLYALGVVAYQMVTGELPFRATSSAAMLMKHISERPRPVLELRPDVPPGMAAAIDRALRKEPEDRWPDARAMRDAMAGIGPADGVGAAAPLRGGPPTGNLSPNGAAATITPSRGGTAQPPSPGAARAAPGVPPLVAPEDGRVPAPAAGDPFAAIPRPFKLPPYPVFPTSTNEEARELWRQRQDEWRIDVRRRMDEDRARTNQPWQAQHGSRALDRFSERPLAERLTIFRRKAGSTLGGVGMLGMINLVTSPFFPWVIFPAWGMLGGLSPYWRNLRSEGITMSDVWHSRLPSAANTPVDPKVRKLESKLAVARAKDQLRQQRRMSWWDRMPALQSRVRSFRRWLGLAVGAPIVGMVIAIPANAEEFMVMASMVSAVAFATSIVKGVRLRRIGIRLRDMIRPSWRERLRSADPRSLELRIDAAAALLVAPDVLAGPHGAAVRQAVQDQHHVRDALARMQPADREMLPDVQPTVDALTERAAALAQALHRLDQDMPHDLITTLDSRLAGLAGTPAADGDRRRALLERQRDTIRELELRRERLASQLDNALLVMQQMKLDLLRLRSAGFQNALEAVTSATQEARALSRDMGFMLDAGNEAEALGSALRDINEGALRGRNS